MDVSHELVAAQAARTPDAVAVSRGEARLTYAELERQATRLAGALCEQGARLDTPVAVCLDRSPELVVAALAVLKAGAAYLPLDPAYPPARLELMVADARAPVAVVSPGLRSRLPASLVAVDPAAQSDARAPRATAASLAYVVYTSGSTGRPKGVAMPHGALANLLAWQCERFEPRAARTLQFSALGFDVSVQETLSTLAAGGTLVLVDEAERRDPAGLAKLVVRERVQRVFMPPLALHHLASTCLDRALLPSDLREVVVAGEQLRITQPIRELFRRLPGCRLENQYGPSETHVVSFHRLPAEVDRWPELPPIGRAIAGARLEVDDGELAIGGVGMARGYLGRPGPTAERFRPDPSAGVPGARRYLSGDRARLQADGELVFLGRVDEQVKLRGFRVELGEVEAQLAAHPRLAAAAVRLLEAAGEDGRLAAYVVPAAGGRAPGAEELRAFLAERLPAHMLPGSYTELERLPLGPHGKLDRQALPLPGPGRAERAGAAPAPARTETERLLAEIWQELLGVDEVGAEDDFFALGGHSLLALRVLARVRERLGVEPTARSLLQGRTIRRLAEALESAPATDAPALRRREGRSAPASPAQERIWFVDELNPDVPLFTLAFVVRFDGDVDPAVLERAFAEVARRHEAVRTTFAARGPRLEQVVRDEPPPFRRVEVEADDDVRRVAERAARERMDLAAGPLLRAELVEPADGRPALVLVLHHAVVDAWSVDALVDELAEAYEALATGREPDLPDLPVQYGDYAAWQRDVLARAGLTRQREHWRNRLARLPPALELPSDRPRPPVRSLEGAVVPVVVPPQVASAAREAARRSGTTVFTVLLAALAALLHARTGESDLPIGAPIANRRLPELEPLVGLFVNTVVLRAQVDPDGSFADHVARLGRTIAEAAENADVPFEEVVEELRPPRDLSVHPLFQVSLAYHQGAAPRAERAGIRVEEVHNGTSQYDLTLAITDGAGGLGGYLEYAVDVFDESTAEGLASDFVALLAAAVGHPEEPVGALADKAIAPASPSLLVGPAPAEEDEATLFELFERTAAATPHGEAVASGERRLDYSELRRASAAVAARVSELGAGPEAVVGICMQRSPELLASFLGVLAAGAVCLPLDPDFPPERLRYMLDEVDTRVVLTHGATAERLPPRHARVESLDLNPLLAEHVDPPAVPRSERRLAYVVFTSGSSGWPKPVGVAGGSLLAYLRAAAGAYCEGGVLGSVLHSSLGVDLTVTSLLLPLVVGGCVRVLGEGERLEDVLGGLVEPCLLKLTPSHLRLLAGLGVRAGVGVRLLVLGGEQLSGADLRAWRLVAPGAALVNEYGPTEATVGCSVYWPKLGEGEPVPIGRPLGGARLAVVDGRLGLMPVGRVGELAIGGPGVARGYLGRPGLTAERFRPDPVADTPGARLYLSGDRARLRPDGELLFLGRADGQLKLRGFRVEPGEIEAQLAAHPQLAAAAVRPVGQRLAAYLVPATGQAAPEPERLRAFLADRLPQHMLPDSYTVLERLPLGPGGKLDRTALPDPTPDRAERTSDQPSPAQTPTEQLLVEIWQHLLNLDLVGSHDDFFTLGGHSLLATQLTHHIRERLGVELPLRTIFLAPTVAALAAAIDEQRAGAPAREDAPIRRLPRPVPPR